MVQEQEQGNGDIRKKIAWLTAIAAGLLIIGLIMIPPVIGLADSGDFGRVLGGTGLTVLNPNASYEQLYFNYAHQYYGYGSFTIGGYISTHVILVALAGLVGKMINRELFDIRVLGACYSIFFIWAVVLMVRSVPVTRNRVYTAVAAATTGIGLLFVFGDIGYLAYFQSFYGEPYALIGMLLAVAAALAIASSPHPSGKLLLLFVAACLAVATSKIQNAPLGFAFALLAWRMIGMRTDPRWRRQIWIGAGILIVGSAIMITAAPDRLKHANLYQSIFFGVLKDSPHVASDMKELGISEKYAALAGTNYFQKDTAIPQSDPTLREEVLEQLSHKDIAVYYLRHPSRLIQKLERAADNAMFIRPHYLGNYDATAGKPPGAEAHSFSVWSKWKENHLPRSLIGYIGLFFAYYAVLGAIWLRRSSRRLRLAVEILAIIALSAIFSLFVPLIGDGEADLGKHLFMFNVCFDMMVVSVVTGCIYAGIKLIAWRREKR